MPDNQTQIKSPRDFFGLSCQSEDVWEKRIVKICKKIARAQRRSTGCHLTADEIQDLAVSKIGQAAYEIAEGIG